jgi:hypothetical protein
MTMEQERPIRRRHFGAAVLLAAGIGLTAGYATASAPTTDTPATAPPAASPDAPPPSAADALTARLLPRPQHLETTGVTVTLGADWRVAIDTSDARYAFAGRWFNAHITATLPITLPVVDGRADVARTRRIVLGDPAVHPFVRDALRRAGRSLPTGLGDEGYVLAASGGVDPEIVIAAHAPSGAFYGVVTLLQLIGADAGVPGVFVVDYPEHTVRGTYEPTNAVMGFAGGRNVFVQRQRDFIDWLAARKFNTLFLVDNGDFFLPEDTWVQAYEELFAYARERFIEPVPRICSISTVGPFPFAYFEGWFVEDEPFTFDEADLAVADHPFVDIAPNGGFETDANGDDLPDGWTVNSTPGATWSVDTTTVAAGTRSMRLDIPVPAPGSNGATLSFSVRDPAPDSFYCVWSKARGENIGEVDAQLTMYAVDADRKVAALESDVTKSTRGWIDFGACVRTPPDPLALTVYTRIQFPGTGTFWIDDVRLYRVNGALRNVIRASDTDIAVTDGSGAVRYALGADYEVTDGQTNMRFMPALAPFAVRRLPGGRIVPGQRVLLNYDTYLFRRLSQYWSSAPCVAREELYTEFYEPAIDAVVAHLHPRILNIDADEIRGFYRDSRMLGRFTSNAEAIAYWANRIQTYLASVDPAARLWIWDDMVSPYHNGGVADYQVGYGGMPGRMAQATERDWIDKSIIMDVWWYGDEWLSQMWQSLAYFGGKGYDVLGSPWLDEENIVSWSEILVGQPHALGGVETNWGTPFEAAHEVFADNFWNTRYRLVLFDSFESDADADGVPDGWQATGRIDYSVDASQSHGRHYADFPNAAVGVTAETERLERSAIAVRPDTPYVLSAFVKRAADAQPAVRLAVVWYDDAGAPLAESAETVADLDTAYRKVELEATAPAGAASASIVVDSPGGAGAGAWVDVVRFKESTRLRVEVGPALLYVPLAMRGGHG